MTVFVLSDRVEFPPAYFADRDGLLAIGGDLSQQRLLLAYKMGIFPWFSEDEPVMWWSPDPRLVLYPRDIKISRSLKKTIRKNVFKITLDTVFREVITMCRRVRSMANERTWIVGDMISAYCQLHEAGFAHSVEAWYRNELVGGLYGVSLGKCFFGESMFTRRSNASKVALVTLVEYLASLSFHMIDCQVATDHLMHFGAKEVPRSVFLKQLQDSLASPTRKGKWQFPAQTAGKPSSPGEFGCNIS